MSAQEKVHNRKVGIIGMARSGLAAAKLVLQSGGMPFVSDNGSREALATSLAQLEELGIAYECGGHTDRLLESDFCILSPGVPQTIPMVQKIKEKGIPIFSEIELASWFCRGKILAVTGSNGKTTTTTLAGEMLKEGGIPVEVCGNIGYPFSDAAPKVPENGFAVVEASSFQLELIESFKPHIAMILNLTPDHLDRYLDFEDYKAAKYRIADNMSVTDHLILNAGDPETDVNKIKTDATLDYFAAHRPLPAGVFKRGESLVGSVGGKEFKIIDIAGIRIPGPHNLQNSAAAALAAILAGVSPEKIAAVLEKFPGVEHRLEDVGTVAGIKFINDSKATNVDSVCYALLSMKTPVVLIAGGRDKGGAYDPLIEKGRGKIKEIILIGEAREKIFRALGKTFAVEFAESMEAAVQKAFTAASPGDTVLLSPACSSFDMFDNYEHRGKTFKEIVARMRSSERPRDTRMQGVD